MRIWTLVALSLFGGGLYAAAAQVPVQVLDMGNTNESVPLSENSEEKHTWLVTDQLVDPRLFSSRMLAGDKRVDTIAEGFKRVDVPSNLVKLYGNRPAGSLFWYYKSFIAPSNPRGTFALRLGKIDDRDQVYLNGVLIGSSGYSGGPEDHAWDKVRIYNIPSVLLRPLEKNILLVRVESYFVDGYGITKDRVEFGDSARMNRDLIVSDVTAVVFLACYLTFGVYFLFLFFRRPQERSYLFFFVFIVALVLYQFFQSQLKYYTSGDFILLKRLEYVVLLGMFPAFYFYIREFFNMQQVRVFRYVHFGVLALCAVNSGLLLVVLFSRNPARWASLNEKVHLQAVMPVFLLVSLGIVIYRIFKKDKDARAIMLGLVCLLGTLVVDNLVYYGIINIPRISSYVIFLFLMSLAFILANQFVRVHNEVEDLNRNLERKVDERTQELQASLKRVQDLKSQQDGDYFLTSLLIEPLSANRVSSDRTQVEFYVKEKKEFSFRRWNREIGGDMCIAHTVDLRGRKFTVALNADAMGKSMQGAGGALVLGSVFASIIERTRNAAESRDMAPETWMRSAFFELNRVFETFDGSMLVSIVLTAIDDEAGVMYYINAEHPWTVLYRKGKASFTDEEFALRKLGTLGVNDNVLVKVFYLEDGDVVIMGSDGRDDLILGIDHEGQRIINEDETLILRHVESTEGDLPKLVDALRSSGDLSDDLSLIKINYSAPPARRQPIRLKDSQAVETFRTDLKERSRPLTLAEIDIFMEKHRENTTEMHQAIRWLFKLKQYAKGAEWAEKFVSEYPMESEFLYLAGFGYKLAGQYEKGRDFAERLFARTVSHEKNLVNLIDLVILEGDIVAAEKVLAVMIRSFPHNAKLPRLTQAVREAQPVPAV
jgi:hypothetical protein